jgi:hypothetical protein
VPHAVRPLPRRALGLVAVLLLLGGLVALGGEASAAPRVREPCKVPSSVGDRAAKVDAVFTAQVTAQETDAVGTGATTRQVRRYSATVERVYQGTVTAKQVIVSSPLSARENGLGQLPTDKTWLFFVNGEGAKFYANSCLGSERATSALLRRVERVLGSGGTVVVPEPERPPLEWTELDPAPPTPLGRLVAPGAAAGIVGLLGLAAVGRARRRTPGG